MNELAHGSVGERPWGCLLASFAASRLSGELAVGAGDRQQIHAVLHDGAIVAATSPLAADSAARIGMTLNMVTSTQVPELTRRLAAAPERDDVDIVAEAIRLAPELAQRLRRRVIALRAARTFSLDGAPYVVDDRVRTPVAPDCAVDVRAVIYLGARTHLATDQLAEAVTRLGTVIEFTDELIDELPHFDFGELELPVVMQLRRGEPLAALLSGRSEAERRVTYAVAYALLAWTRPGVAIKKQDSQDLGGMSVSFRRRPSAQAPSAVGRATTSVPSIPEPMPSATGSHAAVPARTVTPPLAAGSHGVPAVVPSRTRTPPPTSGAYRVVPPQDASGSAVMPSRTTTPPPTSGAFAAVPPQDPPPPRARTTGENAAQPAPPTRARTTGDHTAAPPTRARTTGAHVVEAPALPRTSTTGDHAVVVARTQTPTMRPSGGYPAVTSDKPLTAAQEARLDAEAARMRGEMALRRQQLPLAIEEFQTATRLDPRNGAYSALLAWAQFCAASDKEGVANETRRALARSILATAEPLARLYLGRVERMLGREREALALFKGVLELHPGNAEATSEARVLESRLANKSSSGFGKPKR